jgi:hypothetical protein
MQKGGTSIPCEMQQGYFSKSSLKKNIVAFRLAGYFTWNEEAAGSNPVYYTIGLSCSKAGEKHLQCFWKGSIPLRST